MRQKSAALDHVPELACLGAEEPQAHQGANEEEAAHEEGGITRTAIDNAVDKGPQNDARKDHGQDRRPAHSPACGTGLHHTG